ncbi:MAG TPA: D-alanine--D-alanine ligase [Patescibacteria group bacterium]|nr:D-alanine--D-alanine ligase [Patescibacteria group bacterium]
MRKLNVAVLMGGKSSEHEISLSSGREVVKNLNPKKYNVLPIVIAKDGINWQIGNKKQFLLDSPAGVKPQITNSKTRNLNRSDHASIIKNNHVDIIFIAMHGPNGEDGTIQGFLGLLGIPYTGSGVLASALGMDKIYSRRLFIQVGLNVPEYLVLTKTDSPNKVFNRFKLPLFIKPSNQGSSVGVSKVNKKSDLKKALDLALRHSNLVIVEEYLEGKEITVPVLGNENPRALPVVEIVPKTDFFDYRAKYDEKLCEEIVPARISKKLTSEVQKVAILAYQSLGCRGFGRVDMIIKGQKIHILEVNTIPGLTPVSLFPKSAFSAGIPYSRLLDKIIEFATP